MLTYGQSNVLRWRRNRQLVVEAPFLAFLCPGLLDELATADCHLAGRHGEVQVKGASSQGHIHTGKPCPSAAHLHKEDYDALAATSSQGLGMCCIYAWTKHVLASARGEPGICFGAAEVKGGHIVDVR